MICRSCGCLEMIGWVVVIDRRVWAEKIAKPSDGKDLLCLFQFALHQKWQKLQVIWILIRYSQPRCTQDFTSPRASTNSSSHTTGGWNGQKLFPGSKIRMEWWAWLEVDWVPRLHMQRQLWVFPPFSALGCFWYVQVLATSEKELKRCAKEFGAHILVGGRCLKVPKKNNNFIQMLQNSLWITNALSLIIMFWSFF